jgi:hypothetical protein
MFEKVLRIKKAKNPANYIGSVYLGDQKYNSHLSFMYERSKEEIGLPYLLYKIINFRAINFFSKIITKLR